MDTTGVMRKTDDRAEEKDASGRSVAQMVFFLWRPYKYLVIATFLLILGFTLMEGVSVALLFNVFSQTSKNLTGAEATEKITFIVDSFQRVVPIKDKLVLSCVLLIVGYFIKSILSFFSQFVSFYLSSRTKRDFHDGIFRKFLGSDYSFFLHKKHGWLMHRTMTVPLEASVLLDYIPRIAINVLKIFSIIIMLFFISPMVTGFLAVIAVLYYYATKIMAKRISYILGKGKVVELQGQNELAAEAFSGIKNIKVFNALDDWVRRFKRSLLNYSKIEIKDSVWLLMPPCAMEFTVIAALAATLIVVKSNNMGNFATILPTVAIFGYAVQRIIPSFNLLGAQRMAFSGRLPVLEILYDILTAPKPKDEGAIKLDGLEKGIGFKEVSFSYEGRSGLFEGLSFEVAKGETVAIVGPSGSGKSTIVDLMIGLFPISSGQILINGNALEDLDRESWLSRIGLVSQDTFIFSGTIKDNISFGSENSTEGDIIRAAREGNAHDFISEFPEGYNTVVGDRGVKLSLGQRQRVAIARALLRKPELLILDEATSSLDNISESLVQDAISKVSVSRTVIIVAHRLSTIIDSDKILVLEKGSIAEKGNHAELMNRKGLYWRLYNTQKRSFGKTHEIKDDGTFQLQEEQGT